MGARRGLRLYARVDRLNALVTLQQSLGGGWQSDLRVGDWSGYRAIASKVGRRLPDRLAPPDTGALAGVLGKDAAEVTLISEAGARKQDWQKIFASAVKTEIAPDD